MSPTSAATFGTVRLLRALLAATLIVPALLFTAVAWQERRVLMEEAARRAEASAEVLEQHAAAAFHAYELLCARMDEHLPAAPREDEQARHACLAAIDHEHLKEVGSLFLVDAAGRVTAHPDRHGLPGRDHPRRPASAGPRRRACDAACPGTGIRGQPGNDPRWLGRSPRRVRRRPPPRGTASG